MKPQILNKKMSKQSKLIKLLSRVKGSSVIQLEQELDWQPHAIRAAISRLRKSSRNIATGKIETGTTVYRLLSDAGAEA